jgi:hypothetical protein
LDNFESGEMLNSTRANPTAVTPATPATTVTVTVTPTATTAAPTAPPVTAAATTAAAATTNYLTASATVPASVRPVTVAHGVERFKDYRGSTMLPIKGEVQVRAWSVRDSVGACLGPGWDVVRSTSQQGWTICWSHKNESSEDTKEENNSRQ